MNAPIAFQGEVMLAGWSETHNGGAKVTFWLADEGDLAAFKSMTVAKGKTAGQRLAIVAVEIGDDEQPVARDAVIPASGKPKGEKLSWLAVQLCKNSKFLEFAGVSNETNAREWILDMCGSISSRSDLDSDGEAAEMFHANVRKPFRDWMEARK